MKLNLKIILMILLVLAIGGGALYFFGKKVGIIETPPKVVTDSITIPHSDKITGTEGLFVSKSEGIPVPLVPSNGGEVVVVVDAILTAKGSFDLAHKSALSWAPDAKLVYIKTLGTIMLDGRTSYWQLGFGSLKKKSGYDIVIKGDVVASATEVPTTVYGFELPKNWYDSGDAIDSVRTLPRFRDVTVSQINFFYDKGWLYSVVTSVGSSVIPVK